MFTVEFVPDTFNKVLNISLFPSLLKILKVFMNELGVLSSDCFSINRDDHLTFPPNYINIMNHTLIFKC